MKSVHRLILSPQQLAALFKEGLALWALQIDDSGFELQQLRLESIQLLGSRRVHVGEVCLDLAKADGRRLLIRAKRPNDPRFSVMGALVNVLAETPDNPALHLFQELLQIGIHELNPSMGAKAAGRRSVRPLQQRRPRSKPG